MVRCPVRDGGRRRGDTHESTAEPDYFGSRPIRRGDLGEPWTHVNVGDEEEAADV